MPMPVMGCPFFLTSCCYTLRKRATGWGRLIFGHVGTIMPFGFPVLSGTKLIQGNKSLWYVSSPFVCLPCGWWS